MAIQVLEAEDADMSRIFEICSLAFGDNEPFWIASWPNHSTDVGRKTGAERMIKIKNSDPNTTYLKAVDAASGKVAGMAKWNVFNNTMGVDPSQIQGGDGDYWDDEDEKEYAKQVGPIFLTERNAAIARSGGNVVSLDILAVDPEYQRKGVGAALVAWGTEKADEMGVEAVVESSAFGKGLYEKNGFVFVKDVEVAVPERWAHKPKQRFAWLVRPKVR